MVLIPYANEMGLGGRVPLLLLLLAFLITFAVSMGVTFAYVATSAFILESMNGLAPIVYSIDFAANAIGLTAATLLSARRSGPPFSPLFSVLGSSGSNRVQTFPRRPWRLLSSPRAKMISLI